MITTLFIRHDSEFGGGGWRDICENKHGGTCLWLSFVPIQTRNVKQLLSEISGRPTPIFKTEYLGISPKPLRHLAAWRCYEISIKETQVFEVRELNVTLPSPEDTLGHASTLDAVRTAVRADPILCQPIQHRSLTAHLPMALSIYNQNQQRSTQAADNFD